MDKSNSYTSVKSARADDLAAVGAGPAPLSARVVAATPDQQAAHRRLADIHCFRGVAILFIVAGHCASFFAWNAHGHAEAFAKDLFDDATFFFVFIAGFLFQTTERRFSYPDYLGRKLRNVIAPYMVAITPAIVYALVRGTHSFDAESLHQLSMPEKVGYFMLYGGSTINHALWFVPVISLYYLTSPILIAIDRQKHAYLVLWVLLPVSLLMHRPSFSHGHNLSLASYFLSAYVLGMCCSRFRVPLLAWLDRHLATVVVASLVLFLGHFLGAEHHGKYTTDESFDYQHPGGLIDWIFLQKVLMTFALLGLLRRFRQGLSGPLSFLGDKSFTIYFFHLYVVYATSWLTHFAVIEIDLAPYLLLLVAATALPCGLSQAARSLFPRWSRSLVGS